MSSLFAFKTLIMVDYVVKTVTASDSMETRGGDFYQSISFKTHYKVWEKRTQFTFQRGITVTWSPLNTHNVI